MKKNDFLTVLDALDQTRRLKWASEEGQSEVPPIPSGSDVQSFHVGDTVTSSGVIRKAGLTSVVTEVYEQNGYWYYVTESLGTMRTKDLVR